MPSTHIRSKVSSLALALTLTSFAVPAGAAGTLTLSQVQDPGSWDPVDTYLVNWASVAANIFDGLVYRGPDMQLVPGLATSWEELDDGLRIRFTLRENVQFHNGEPFNAEAVRFTFDRVLGKDGTPKGPQYSNYAAIDRVEVIDDHTVDLVLSQRDPVLITKLAGYGGMIVPPHYIQENGDEYFNTHPVGTGPFKFVSYEPKINIMLEPFAGHWDGTSELDSVVFRFIAEPATQVAELQAGRVDIMMPPLPISMIPTVEDEPSLRVESVTSPTVYALRFNTRDGITSDENVRKALIMAIDRAAIIESILGGQAKPIASFQADISFGYDPELEPLAYDPAAARQLLDQAGVAPGTTVQIDYRGSDTTFGEVAQAVAGYLQMVGITASLKPYETNVFLNDIVPAGRTGEMFQQGWGGWTLDYDNTAYLMYHTGERWNPYDSDPKLDELLESQRMITNRAEREAILKEIGGYAADRALEMPLYNINSVYGVNQRVKNFTPAPDNRVRLTDVTVE